MLGIPLCQGFRKVHPERWEFANDDFVKDQKHLLKNIYRRKPIHSHTQPVVDAERVALEEEIEKLLQDKTAIQSNIFRFKQHHSAAKTHLQVLSPRLDCMEERQANLLNFFEKALDDPTLVQHISRKIESMDLLAYNKKRRLPQVNDNDHDHDHDHHLQPVAENSFVDSFGMEFGNVSHQDSSNKLTLELSPAVFFTNMVASCSTPSSNEDGESPHKMLPSETPELSPTGASFTFNMDSCLSQTVTASEFPKLDSLEPNCDDGESYISCLLNLSLASSSLQVKRNSCTYGSPEFGKLEESKSCVNDDKESDVGASSSRNLDMITDLTEAPPTAPIRVNDVFWEQFLTERPGCSDKEESIYTGCGSNKLSNADAEQDEGGSVHGNSANVINMDQLTL